MRILDDPICRQRTWKEACVRRQKMIETILNERLFNPDWTLHCFQLGEAREVKAAASVQSTDFKGLRRLREIVGAQFVTGIVLYNGTHALPFGEGLWAVPLARL